MNSAMDGQNQQDTAEHSATPSAFDNAAAEFSQADFKRTVKNAMRTVAIATVVGVPLIGWKAGWPNAALFAIGALISGSGLMQWLRLLSALAARIERTGEAPSPFARVLIGFFLRLAIALLLLYGSLKYLNGSVYALVAGLALGGVALLIEALRLLKSWTE
jgi:hypothetical protein